MGKKNKYSYLWLVLLLILSLLLSGCSKKEEAVKETELSVNAAQVKKGDIAKSVHYSGVVRGSNEVYIIPKVSARVTGIFVKPGDRVNQGQTLMTLDNRDYVAAVKIAEAGKRANDASLQLAGADLERTQRLYESGAVSAQQLEQAQAKYDGLAAGSADAALEQAQTQLNNCTITSPINGVVGSINLSLGDNTSMQSPAVVVSDSSKLETEIMVSESEVGYIQVGSDVEINIRAASNKLFKGQVESVSSVPDPDKRNYAVKVTMNNMGNKIRSGMFAEVRVDTISKKDVLYIPVSAVIPTGGREIVYTVDKDKRAREIEVQSGIKNDNYVEIVKGLQAGQEVITKGNTLVEDGTLVRVVAGGSE
ncbi:MAG: efflux RND transporter periplasmic adaptor subunit [Syntrophomonas sp.]